MVCSLTEDKKKDGPYYHVYVDCLGDETLELDLDEAKLTKYIISPFNQKRRFQCKGLIVDPSDVDCIRIIETEKQSKEIISRATFVDRMLGTSTQNNFSILEHHGKDVTRDFIVLKRQKMRRKTPRTAALKSEQSRGSSIGGLIDSAHFLGLTGDWFVATCALQLQETAIMLAAKKKNIDLGKPNVERLLKKRISSGFFFNDQYEAFIKELKSSFDVDMPLLTTDLRRMRTRVLHQGYNPTPEEANAIADFTIGLLRKLDVLCQTK